MAPQTRLSFSREHGTYALRRGSEPRDAPRVLQVGLLTPCNLSCGFCYRDKAAPSRLDRAFLVPLLQQAADWGVREVAFGGGEPLLFPELVPMLQQLHETTPLGLNLTTNGLLLRGRMLEQLAPLLGEVRVSAYPDNRYLQTLQRTRHLQTGLNLMVTPANAGIISALVHDALRAGADNVLLLGYKGDDPSLHLSPGDRDRLRAALRSMAGLPLRLDICLYPHFSDLPHLFGPHDCGAGDDFLTITPDRAVQACSFSTQRHPFETFAELKALHAALRQARPAADTGGCTRAAFSQQPPAVEANTVWLWQDRAGNNSSTYTLLAEFCDPQTAQDAAEILQQFFADVHRFYKKWSIANGADHRTQWRSAQAMALPPPVVDFIEKYELDVTTYQHGILDNTNAPTIVGLGRQLLLHHQYCLGLDTALFRVFFEKFAGQPITTEAFGLDASFLLECTASGHHPEVVDALEDFLTDPYPDDCPPWAITRDQIPALWPHQQYEAHEYDAEVTQALPQRVDQDGIHLQVVSASNLAAVAARLHDWLQNHGYQQITITVREHASP